MFMLISPQCTTHMYLVAGPPAEVGIEGRVVHGCLLQWSETELSGVGSSCMAPWQCWLETWSDSL